MALAKEHNFYLELLCIINFLLPYEVVIGAFFRLPNIYDTN